jgi:hypothetical protein
MKKIFLAMTFLGLMGADSFAQTTNNIKSEQVQYHFFVNNIPSDWNYPLVGIVNNVNGNHASVQAGIINSTSEKFGGIQAGFINSVSGCVVGGQGGFINSIGGEIKGIQTGFINSVGQSVYGIQDGFINSVGNSVYGIQGGFVNSTGNEVIGVQCGFINSTGTMMGFQCGFINSAKTLRGLQLGFINSVDNLEKGLPIGFLSFVKHGGYQAIEVSYNNISPLNVSFKTGVREFYTYPMLAYDWRLADDRLSFGYGIGSNLDINSRLFINPEMEWLHQVSLDFNHYSTLRCNLGYNLGNHIELVAGPSLVWQFKIDAADFHHSYDEWDPAIVSVNEISLGWNVALRYKF